MGLLDRIAPRKGEPDVRPQGLVTGPAEDPVFATKALRKFLASLTSREMPVLLDLGPLVGSNVSFFGEQLGCKIFVEDLIDYLDRPAAQALAEEVTRVLRPDGALLGFFGTAQPRDTRYTKYIVIDEVNLKHKSYPAARGRQAILLNRDILRLFSGLRVSDSFLLQNN